MSNEDRNMISTEVDPTIKINIPTMSKNKNKANMRSIDSSTQEGSGSGSVRGN